MNSVILIGRLVRDPEVKTINGYQAARFTLAVNRAYKNENNQYDADFINCIAWRQTADLVGKSLKKGNPVCVAGSIQTSSWDGQDGKKQYSTEVVVERVEFIAKKDGATDAGNNC